MCWRRWRDFKRRVSTTLKGRGTRNTDPRSSFLPRPPRWGEKHRGWSTQGDLKENETGEIKISISTSGRGTWGYKLTNVQFGMSSRWYVQISRGGCRGSLFLQQFREGSSSHGRVNIEIRIYRGIYPCTKYKSLSKRHRPENPSGEI